MSRAEKLLEYCRLLEQKGTWETPSLTLLFSRAENLGRKHRPEEPPRASHQTGFFLWSWKEGGLPGAPGPGWEVGEPQAAWPGRLAGCLQPGRCCGAHPDS